MIISLSKYNLEGCMDPISNIFLQCQFGLLFERGKSILFPPVLHYSEAPWCHAVDTPVGDAVLVTDTDTEPPIVCSHHFDDGAVGTLQV